MSNRILKGILKNTQNGWVINHDIIDPYGQVPIQLPIHPSDNENLIDGEEIQFEVVYEYYGKLKLKD